MQVVVLGLGHDVAPVVLRERAAIPRPEVPAALWELKADEHVLEVVILSTCNRTELYAVTENPELARDALARSLSGRCGLDRAAGMDLFAWRQDDAAVRHLFRVAAGLESQILGEGQILGQVREAASLARQLGASGPVLDALFRHAIGAGKRVRTDTSIAAGAVSVGSAAVELAREAVGGFAGRTVLLIGAGKIAENALRHIASQGISRVLVANRTYEAAREVAGAVGGEAIAFTGLRPALRKVDVVFCCTSSPHFILGPDDLRFALRGRRDRPMVVVDLSVPRNIDPAAGSVPGVKLYNVDHLAAVAKRNHQDRAHLVPEVEAILVGEMTRWDAFLRSFEAAPTITGLREKVEDLRTREFESFVRERGTGLAPEDLAAIEQLTRQLAAKILHGPTVGLRGSGDRNHAPHAKVIRELFGLNPQADARQRVRRA